MQDPSPHTGTTVVVGAGIAGLTTALFLRRRGLDVVVVEQRNGVAEEASFLNGGLLCPSLTYPWANPSTLSKGAYAAVCGVFRESFTDVTDRVLVRRGVLTEPGFFRWAWRFAVNSLLPSRVAANFEASYVLSAYSLSLMMTSQDSAASSTATTSLGLPPASTFHPTATGTLSLFSSLDARASLVNHISTIHNRHPDPTNSVILADNVDGFRAIDPCLTSLRVPASTCAVYSSQDSSGDIRAYCLEVEKRARDLGVKFLYGTAVVGAKVQDGTCVSVTLKDVRHPDARPVHQPVSSVVNCAGNGAPAVGKLLGDGATVCSLPVKGLALEVGLTDESPGLPVTVVDDTEKVYVAPITRPGRRRAVRVSGFVELSPGTHSIMRPARRDALLAQARAMLPPASLDESSVVARACSRPQTPDDLPIVGPSPIVSNVFINAGHGHLGWTRAVGSSALLTALMCGDEDLPIDPTPYLPARFLS